MGERGRSGVPPDAEELHAISFYKSAAHTIAISFETHKQGSPS